MAAIEELIRTEADGGLSFGNHTLSDKAKKEDFSHDGGSFKVKTFSTMTKLERDGVLVYESVPGTSVSEFKNDGKSVSFFVEGSEDAQLTLGLDEDTEYSVSVDGNEVGKMKTNLGGKLSISAELSNGPVSVEVKKA